MQDLSDNIPELKIEFVSGGVNEGLILLTQGKAENVALIAIHPTHLKFMQDKMGINDVQDSTTQKTIATLTRRLFILQDRIEYLANWLVDHSDNKHADLSYEQTYARATADIADEFCLELEASSFNS